MWKISIVPFTDFHSVVTLNIKRERERKKRERENMCVCVLCVCVEHKHFLGSPGSILIPFQC